MFQRIVLRFCAILCGLALGWGACELALARLVHADADGNRSYRGLYLRPYRLPQRRLAELLARYHGTDSTRIVYSPGLGWDARPIDSYAPGATIRTPGFRSRRAPESYSRIAPRDTARILLFGDSFTLCATAESESWGRSVEDDLLARGVPAQVLNFGVGGYGIDQAFMRWRQYGRAYAPDVVVFGFQPENVKRDLNLIRLVYQQDTGLPFTKPRFELDGDRLVAINLPAAPPESLPAILSHLPAWPLVRHEAFYDPLQYREHVWLKSRLLALMDAALRFRGQRLRADESKYYDPAGACGRLALAILERFRAEVEDAGARFVIVELPRREDLAPTVEGRGTLVYPALRAEIERRFTLIDTRPALAAAARADGLASLFRADSHYDARGNRAVADAVTAYFAGHPAWPRQAATSGDAAAPRPRVR